MATSVSVHSGFLAQEISFFFSLRLAGLLGRRICIVELKFVGAAAETTRSLHTVKVCKGRAQGGWVKSGWKLDLSRPGTL